MAVCDRPLRILYVVPYYSPAFIYGGPVRSISTLCKALVSVGADVTVFTTDANGEGRLDVPVGQPVDVNGVKVYYFRCNRGLLPFYSAGLGQACAQHIRGFDLVHSSSLWTYPMGPTSAASRSCCIPRVESPRGGLMPWDFHHKYWKKRLYLALFERRRLDTATAIHCTDEMEQEAIKELELRPSTFVVPNPVELSGFSTLPVRGRFRAQLGLPQDSTVTLFLGRIAPKKGLDLATHAFGNVVSRHPDAHFIVAGPEEDDSGVRVRRLVHEAGLQNRVHFVGMIAGETRLSALADADLFILTSHSENFGLAAAEALATGVPVLLSDQVGIARQVAQVRAGAVVKLNISDISQTWSALLDNPTELKVMGIRGHKLVKEEYAAGPIAHKMLGVYHQILRDWQSAQPQKS